MSVVAIKVYDDKIVIGADTQSTRANKIKLNSTKLLKVNDNLTFGHCGNLRDTELFYAFAKENNINEHNQVTDIYDFLLKYKQYLYSKIGTYEEIGEFIIVNNGKAFRSINNIQVEEITDFDAIGSGDDIALTALYLGKTVEEAIEITTKLDLYCALPMLVFTINKHINNQTL